MSNLRITGGRVIDPANNIDEVRDLYCVNGRIATSPSAEQKAEAVLLFFGYTFCPDVCPLTMSKIAQVYDQLKVGPEQLLTVFISVDAVRDTPQILKEYLGYFSVGAIGLSGSEEVLGRVIEMFGAQYRIDESTTGNYLINHSTGTYLLDAKKAVRFLFDHQDSATKMALVVQALFNEQSKNVVTSGTVGVDTSLIFTLLQYPGICGASPVGNIMDDSFWFIDNQTAANRVPVVPLPQPTFPFGLTHRQ